MKKFFILSLIGALLFAEGAAFAAPTFITIVTGSTGGTYYPVGTILANHFNTALMSEGLKASAQSSGGTVENLEMLSKGEAEMAIAMSNLTGFAYKGEVRYEGKPNLALRYVIGLWPDVTQLVYAKDSGITSFADLKGKRFAVGPAASGTEFTSRLMLRVLSGLTFDDIKPEYVGYSEAAQALQNGRIDIFNGETGVPTAAVAELYAGRTPVDMLEFSEDDMAKLKKEAPYYARVVIPAGVYPKQDRDLQVVGVKSALIVHKDVDADTVYKMLKVIYDDREAMKQAHAAFSKVDYDNPLDGLYGAPLHPGAVRFYREMGLEIPEELMPD